MKVSVFLSFATAAVAGILDARKGHCGGDNCARQVTGTRKGLGPLSSRKADCSSFMRTVVAPEATTITVTVTVDPEEPVFLTRHVIYRAATETPTEAPSVPTYASSCKNAHKYSSACSCWGITPAITFGPVPTETRTVTVTLDYCDGNEDEDEDEDEGEE
ncbi:hypothetical protein E4U57_001649 [Claviceps arundinis]|uniref:Uncharacterized protein n=1 Tax=Claviceps arundinis TaxID=1623583 RepID=A0A9P7MVL5_9HYPO|nr:hypothetical protein E4U57_001649 [Claviceps arundinis]KAG5970404.1 hypothetical protein E4U56_007734 [Claviceps arundinis]